ncbi:MAG: DUF1501 domain-containing protein [Hyphomicrobiaceae bacterium]
MAETRAHSLVTRRQMLVGGASLALWAGLPNVSALAAGRDPRLLVVILRGGLDGLSLAPPIGDPDYIRLRGEAALPRSGPGAGLALDGFFALNGNMPFLHGLYGRKQALIVHAVATPYRGRSHFDGQDVLESGLATTTRSDDGWLNRALAGLDVRGRSAPLKGLAMGPVVPLVMRGSAPVVSWIPPTFRRPLDNDTVSRLMDLYAESDPVLARALAEGVEIDRVSMAGPRSARPPMTSAPPTPQTSPAMPATPRTPPRFRLFIETAETAARLMSAADGPRIGALSYNGWDTHANEGAATGQLGQRLAGLDAAIKAFADGMGAAWKHSVVAVVTEFGRTARINGTRGSDHGTGTVAILAGGSIRGGRMIADWPGLSDRALRDGRDLAPTTDLRAVFKGLLRDHLAIPEQALARRVFPDSAAIKPFDGLLA